MLFEAAGRSQEPNPGSYFTSYKTVISNNRTLITTCIITR